MQRCMTANGAHDLHTGALGEGTLDVDDFVVLANREVDGLADFLLQPAHDWQGNGAHVQSCFDQIAQFE